MVGLLLPLTKSRRLPNLNRTNQGLQDLAKECCEKIGLVNNAPSVVSSLAQEKDIEVRDERRCGTERSLSRGEVLRREVYRRRCKSSMMWSTQVDNVDLVGKIHVP